jgi:hypothetical protein
VNRTLERSLVGAAVVVCGAVAFLVGRLDREGVSEQGLEIHGTPGVVIAIRDVAKLESTSFHVEKVVEASDEQSHLWGMVQAKDALLLVAVGDVVAGVDLTKVRDEDVRIDPVRHVVHIRLPAPEVTSSTLDEHATHVYARSTDVLAQRSEQLEGEARRSAEEQMRKMAVDGGILERARASADRTLRALLRSLGYTEVELEWGSA